jgi:phage shock protein A
MTQSINPLLKPENRKEFIQQAMKEMSEQQEEVIKKADNIIENVALFEENVRKQFALYTSSH